MKPKQLKAPFPYPGGKSKVADEVWMRFGNVRNYIEPFSGSLAVLLRRPMTHFDDGYRIETVNDINHFLVNFWRAVASAPEIVAKHADWHVTEADLHARHKWLIRSSEAASFRNRILSDPTSFNAKIAGWWVWGQCCWIGGGWCQENPATADHKTKGRETLKVCGEGGMLAQGRPQLADAYDIGRGVNANAAKGSTKARRSWLIEWMQALSDRLRLVRTCYGHWSRICDSTSTLTRLGTTGIFVDAPYPTIHGVTGEKSRDDHLYTGDKDQDLSALRDEILTWCLKWGNNAKIRIAVCGYEGDGYEKLIDKGWFETVWHASGGYANQRRAGQKKSSNAKRERIWWSPACLRLSSDRNLFSTLDELKARR